MAKDKNTQNKIVFFLALMGIAASGNIIYKNGQKEKSSDTLACAKLNSENEIKRGSLIYPTAYDAINETNGSYPQYEMPTNVYVSKVWYEYNSQIITPSTQAEEAQILMNGGKLQAIETSDGYYTIYYNSSALDTEKTKWIYVRK